jgi:thiol-disulfide isomerase/thioredoxin
MNSKNLLILIIFVFKNVFCLGQKDINIKLNFSEGSYPLALSLWIEGKVSFDMSYFKGVPDSIKTKRILYLDLNDLQGVFDRYIKGKMRKNDYDLMKAIDTSEFSKTSIRHGIFILSGFYKGDKIIISDSNNNGDFSDDKSFTFLKTNYKTKENFHLLDSKYLTTFRYDFFEKKQQKVVSKYIKVELLANNPFTYSGKNAKDTEFDFFVRLAENRKAQISINGKCYELIVSAAPGSLDDYEYDYGLYIDTCNYNFNRKYNSEEIIHKNQKFKMGEYYYQATINRFGDSINLKNYGKNQFREINRNRTLEGIVNKVDLLEYKGKYLIIDFWGTWCQPCIRSLHHIKEINEFIDRSKIELIGVAFDVDKKRVQRHLNTNGYKWTNAFEHMGKMNNFNSLVKELNISIFPTTILVDNEGRILEESLPVDDIYRLKEILSKHIK